MSRRRLQKVERQMTSKTKRADRDVPYAVTYAIKCLLDALQVLWRCGDTKRPQVIERGYTTTHVVSWAEGDCTYFFRSLTVRLTVSGVRNETHIISATIGLQRHQFSESQPEFWSIAWPGFVFIEIDGSPYQAYFYEEGYENYCPIHIRKVGDTLWTVGNLHNLPDRNLYNDEDPLWWKSETIPPNTDDWRKPYLEKVLGKIE